MAFLYKPVRTIYLDAQGKRVKKGAPGANKVRQRSRIWWGRYAQPNGQWVPVALFTDKTASGIRLAELVRQAEIGINNPFDEHAKKPLLDHLDDFERSLTAGGSTAKQVMLKIGRIRRVIDGARFQRIGDISASKVQDYLAELRRTGVLCKQRNGKFRRQSAGIATLNYYLREMKAFTRWLVRDRRTADNVLAHLQGGMLPSTSGIIGVPSTWPKCARSSPRPARARFCSVDSPARTGAYSMPWHSGPGSEWPSWHH
jgi:hypothetical protein